MAKFSRKMLLHLHRYPTSPEIWPDQNVNKPLKELQSELYSVLLHRLDFIKFRRLINELIENYPVPAWILPIKCTPLYLAIETKNFSVVEYLVSRQIGINQFCYSVHRFPQTPLTLAIKHRFINIIDCLLRCEHVDVNLRNNLGQSPLYLAVRYKLFDVIKRIFMHPTYRLPPNREFVFFDQDDKNSIPVIQAAINTGHTIRPLNPSNYHLIERSFPPIGWMQTTYSQPKLKPFVYHPVTLAKQCRIKIRKIMTCELVPIKPCRFDSLPLPPYLKEYLWEMSLD